MTSRKNQQAARQYMKTHDVSYMEALRRVTTPRVPEDFASQSVASAVGARPMGEPLILGYVPPLEPEPLARTLMDRLRGRRPEAGHVDGPTPYLANRESSRPSLITVYGPPGTGKTMLLRSILEQYRGYAAYAVHGGDLIKGEGHHGALGVEPWEGLTEVNLQPWATDTARPEEAVPEPPSSIGDLPNGALMVLDLSYIRKTLTAGFSMREGQVRTDLNKWLDFESALGHVARSKGIVVASSVLTEYAPSRAYMPLSTVSSPLGAESINVRHVVAEDERRVVDDEGIARPRTRWVYEATRPESRLNTEHFTLTEREVLGMTLPRASEEGTEEQWRA